MIPVTGGTLVSPSDGTRYIIPSNVFTAPVTLTHTVWPSNTLPSIGGLGGIGHAFDASVMFGPGGLALPVPGQILTVTVDYGGTGPVSEDTLGLWWWTGTGRSQSGITSTVNLSTQPHRTLEPPDALCRPGPQRAHLPANVAAMNAKNVRSLMTAHTCWRCPALNTVRNATTAVAISSHAQLPLDPTGRRAYN